MAAVAGIVCIIKRPSEKGSCILTDIPLQYVLLFSDGLTHAAYSCPHAG
nr:MAG TPA: hypothetical protein [Caudoviricetes sp.]